MEIGLDITGGLMVLLALFHIVFPRYFRWKEEFVSVSLINREMMYVHTFFIALVVLMMGVFCLTSADDLVHTPLGHRVTLGFALFWLIRLIIQFFGYSSANWRGKRFETCMHLVFTCLWIFFTAVFFYAALKP